jgi:hypothetical protein
LRGDWRRLRGQLSSLPSLRYDGCAQIPAKVDDFGDEDLLKHIDLARILSAR